MPRDRTTTRQVIRRFTMGSGPLKRTSDRLQCLARVVLAVVLLSSVAVALAVATVTSTLGRSEVLAQAAERIEVSAELSRDASAPDGSWESVPEVWLATAVWTGPSGVEHTGTIPVPVRAEAGSRHTVWIDRDGGLTTRPLSTGDVVGRSVGNALLTFLGTSLLACGAYRSVRGLLDRSRSRQWATEWALVEPEWTGKVP